MSHKLFLCFLLTLTLNQTALADLNSDLECAQFFPVWVEHDPALHNPAVHPFASPENIFENNL